MEFGLLGINEFDPTKDGSGSVKRERSDPFDIDSSSTKMGGKRVDEFGMRSEEDKPQMLSFSSSDKPELVGFLSAKDLRLASDRDDYSSFYYHHHQNPSSTPSPYTYSRTSPGFGTGNMNGGMHGSFTGIRGPFTPAQWIELEHQAMIYKYFTANVPVPSNLLIPIRKAIQSVGFPGFSIASYPSHSYGWGSFHLGFSGNGDPEPGRCRRTDGKKWRCSRDAVPDQKYCERHINRGRHRSRKLVEGHTGQAASATATTTTTTKVLPPLSTSTSTSGGGGAVVPSGIAISPHHLKGSLPAPTPNPSTITKRPSDHHQQGRALLPHPIVNLESSKDTRYSSSIPKQQHTSISFDETSISDFGVVSNDSLLNPTQKSSYLMEFNTQQTEEEDQSSLRHFMENWPPKPQSNRSPVVPWPKDLKSDWTQLSMSIPMTTTTTTTDFSSSSSSPNQESATVHPSQVGLGGVGADAWGNSMGGPLGEVLNHSSIAFDNNKGESPQLGASPTGVLQKSTFVTVSNSSSVGSPTAGGSSKTLEGVTVVVS